jgi:hypothetical protein
MWQYDEFSLGVSVKKTIFHNSAYPLNSDKNMVDTVHLDPSILIR